MIIENLSDVFKLYGVSLIWYSFLFAICGAVGLFSKAPIEAALMFGIMAVVGLGFASLFWIVHLLTKGKE